MRELPVADLEIVSGDGVTANFTAGVSYIAGKASGAAGSVFGPGGTILGAGIGGMIGRAIENLSDKDGCNY